MQNIVNILASLTLVYVFGMKIEGVALGTLIAQYAGFIVALFLLHYHYGRLRRYLVMQGIFIREAMGRLFKINRDIFLRTLCLVAVNLFFTSAGARSGAVILSVNAVLLQMYLFFSYFMDGFAYAGEALGGKTYGAKNTLAFRETLRRLWMWTLIVTSAYTLLYICFGEWIVSILTNESQVLATSSEYVFWVWLIPVAGAMAFIWDGIFIGLTATRGMLVSSFISALIFFVTYYIFRHSIGNHALWLAQIMYLAMRGIIQSFWFRMYLSV
jgi:MATE family multidrug resistance protein